MALLSLPALLPLPLPLPALSSCPFLAAQDSAGSLTQAHTVPRRLPLQLLACWAGGCARFAPLFLGLPTPRSPSVPAAVHDPLLLYCPPPSLPAVPLPPAPALPPAFPAAGPHPPFTHFFCFSISL
ncbi:hypothetical protein B0H13DRAFT_2371330 [Mycena leptocephala]|nr:hypothetical protein B0H13DRAFT_2371330 [Mycena leptocephala]